MKTYIKPNEHLLSQYVATQLPKLKLTENMKSYIRRQQHKNFKHQDIKQKELPQKYRLGTISNKNLLAGLNGLYMAINLDDPFVMLN